MLLTIAFDTSVDFAFRSPTGTDFPITRRRWVRVSVVEADEVGASLPTLYLSGLSDVLKPRSRLRRLLWLLGIMLKTDRHR
jgi:hypothetical protein